VLQISYAKVKGIHKYTINHRVTPQINVQITVAKKPTRCHMLSFISPLQAAQHVSGNICPSSGTDCMALLPLVGTVPWLQEGCQNRLAGSVSIEEFIAVPRTPQRTHYLLTGSMPTRGDNTTQSSAPEDGHMLPETC